MLLMMQTQHNSLSSSKKIIRCLVKYNCVLLNRIRNPRLK